LKLKEFGAKEPNHIPARAANKRQKVEISAILQLQKVRREKN